MLTLYVCIQYESANRTVLQSANQTKTLRKFNILLLSARRFWKYQKLLKFRLFKILKRHLKVIDSTLRVPDTI